jgi:cell division septal protein FtsQ
LLAVLLAVITWGLADAFAVKSVVVKSTTSSAASEYQARLQTIVNGSWRQQNLLTADTSALGRELLSADVMLATAEVRRQWPHGLVATVSLKVPALGWRTGVQDYMLDSSGGVIGSLPAGSKLPTVVDDSNLPVHPGQRVVGAKFVTFVTALAQALPGLKLSATKYEIKDTTYDLYVTTTAGYRLILDTSRAAGEQVSDIDTMLKFLTKQHKRPAEYIDLRVPGRAYYK